MKIAAFHSDNVYSGWIQAQGFAEILERMGNEVVSIPVPARTRKISKAMAEKINKPIDDCDLVIVSGPEWLSKWIQTFYPNWNALKMPKVGWYHESFVREDFTLDFSHYEKMYDFHFFPDKADAEKYGHPWLPLGVDTKIFNPYRNDVRGVIRISQAVRDIPVAFIGNMYPKRARFVESLKPFLGDIDIVMRYPNQTDGEWTIPAICVYDFDGLNVRRSAELLAEAYRRIKVFVTFPALSNVLVAKVLESTACGCQLVAPKESLVHVQDNYPPSNFMFPYDDAEDCARKIRLALDSEAPTTAPDFISIYHRMELRFEQIFQRVGINKATSAA